MADRFWYLGDLAQHIEAHNKPQVARFTVGHQLGSLSSDFEIPVWIPHTTGLRFERAYLCCTAAHPPNSAAFWTLRVDQVIDGRYRALSSLGTDRRAIPALETTIFSTTDAGLDLLAEEPIVFRGTKTGSPAAIANCLLVLVCSVA